MALTAIHPGEHLAEELKELRMSAAELRRHGIPKPCHSTLEQWPPAVIKSCRLP
jgi:hypothetical protein